jgi:YYY domain-containing protein
METFMRDILAWALATEIVGLAVLPLLRAYFANRRDAALLSRPVGLALTAYLGWALSLLWPFGFRRFTLMIALAVLAAASLLLRRKSPPDSLARAAWWGDEERLAAILFWSATGVFLLIRAVGPAILGAEKFMDLAFLNSLARYPGMPPLDPWMSGKTINYYYWGYLLAAAQAKLSGVAPLTAYNLSVASFAGFSFTAAACLGFRLSRGRLAVGLAAAGGTVFAGNLMGALDAWSAPFSRDFDYWHASRVIGDGKTINEFPFFTFFHADLHPHLLAFPYCIAALALAHRWMERGPSEAPGPRGLARSALRQTPSLLLLALISGTASAASLWNQPAMAILLVFAGVFWPVQGRRLPRLGDAAAGGCIGALAFLAGALLFQPYHASFQLVNQGLGRADLFSGWLELLGVWGTLFAVTALAVWPAPAEDTEPARRRRDFFLLVTAALSLLAGFALKAPALALLFFFGVLTARVAWSAVRTGSPEGDPDGLFAAFLILLGLAMIAGCELVYFRDNYGHDLERMNTIFKFYHQAWPLLAIGAAALAGRAWERGGRRRLGFRAVVAAVVLASALYPINAAVSRVRQKDGPFSLDARGPLRQRNAGDAEAIEWLTKHAPVGSVILEATGDPYSEYARISSHTGIPTVLGWANHEGLWRSNDKEVAERSARVRHFYSAADPRRAWETIQKYGVTHVVVGDMERRSFPRAADVANFPFLEPMALGGTVVYRVQRPK